MRISNYATPCRLVDTGRKGWGWGADRRGAVYTL